MLAIVKGEGGLTSRGVDAIVVGKLGEREPVVPVILSLVDKESKEEFNLLVDAFGLTIGLRVECSGGTKSDTEKFPKLSGEIRYKLGSPVANDLLG